MLVFHCPKCDSTNVIKNGKNSAGNQISRDTLKKMLNKVSEQQTVKESLLCVEATFMDTI